MNKAINIMRMICACWVITKLICFPLWTGTRDFPLVPVFDFFNQIPAEVHIGLLVMSLLLMTIIVFRPSRKIMTGILLIEFLICMLDQNRWQPWQYQFMLMGLVYIIFREPLKVKAGWLVIITGVYFYSGFSKLSPDFIHDTWQWLILNRWLGIQSPPQFLVKLGYFIPLVEMAVAILIWTRPFRKLALIAIICIHLFNLLLVGPTGLNINAVIWPWNLFMPYMIYILIRENDQLLPVLRYQFLFIILCWFLPFLAQFGLWDRYLSFTLYSGGVPQLMICSDAINVEKYAAGIDRSNSRIPCDKKLLAAWDWGMNTMNTAPYPELRVYRKLAEEWNKKYPGSPHKFFIVRSGFQYRVEILK